MKYKIEKVLHCRRPTYFIEWTENGEKKCIRALCSHITIENGIPYKQCTECGGIIPISGMYMYTKPYSYYHYLTPICKECGKIVRVERKDKLVEELLSMPQKKINESLASLRQEFLDNIEFYIKTGDKKYSKLAMKANSKWKFIAKARGMYKE
jgi:hypothetical protein